MQAEVMRLILLWLALFFGKFFSEMKDIATNCRIILVSKYNDSRFANLYDGFPFI